MVDQSFVISACSKVYHWKGAGLCSIKTFSNGDAYYSTGSGFYRVDQNSFLLLNDKTEYEIEIEGDTSINSFCIFFEANLLRELHMLQSKDTSFILDNYGFFTDTANFIERTYENHLLNGSAFSHFKSDYPLMKDDDFWLFQSFAEIVNYLPEINKTSLAQIENIQLVNPSIRKEIYRRVLLAREYIHSNIYNNPSLQEISLAATLSVNHLLRCFRQVFHITPHQYIIDLKINKAKELLSTECLSIREICTKLQFSSLGTFSNSFKKKTGFAPSDYSTKKGDFE